MADAATTVASLARRCARELRRGLSGVRLRVVAGYVVLLVTALTVAAVVIRQVLHTRLDRRVELTLAQEVDELRLLAAGTDPRTGQPFGGDVAALFETFLARNVPGPDEFFYTFVAGRPHRTSAGAPPEVLEDLERLGPGSAGAQVRRVDLETGAGEARLLAVPLLEGGELRGTFVVALLPAAEQAEVGAVVRTIVVVGALVLVASAALAWSLAARVLRPVAQLTRTARLTSHGDLDARIPIEGNDELAQLGITFNAMLDRLQAAFTGQRRFLDDVAHELRTPLTIVRGHLELLDDDPAERSRQLDVVTDELDRMGRYVADLLVVAKAGQPDFLRSELVDVGELMEGLLDRVQPLGDRDWQVESAPRPGELFAFADPDRLTQAVVNLAGNAVEHTGPGDVIALGSAADAGRLRLWVRDTGPGVDPAVRDSVFTRFARSSTSERGRPEGTGIGLALVDAIARAHRGQATVGDGEGGGAVFSLVLPVLVDAGAPGGDDEEDVP